jgi:hypothetical protein
MGVRKSKEVWIGLIEVVPMADHERFGSMEGAVVHALALASSKRDFQKSVRIVLQKEKLHVVRNMEVEPFSQRTAFGTADDAIRQLASLASGSGEVMFGIFYAYEKR